MKKFITTTLALYMFSGLLFSQSEPESEGLNHNWCGHYHFTEQHYEAHPEDRVQAELDLVQFNHDARNFDSSLRDGDPYVIPVVFHIVHAGGSENISDEQVWSAIEVMNEDYSASNPDLGNTIPEFEGIIADVGIEFRLAKIDPDGNCTNGINRVYDEDTNDATDGNIKNGEAAIWDRSSYLNIWVVRVIEGNTVAYAYFPANWSNQVDGIMVQSTAVGRIGTSNDYNSHTLSHEVGHYLRLNHVWGSSNTPGLASNCNMDDFVNDTPETLGRQWSGQVCDLYDETCGSLDNVQNQMDYSWCSTMFTEGQKTRMITALNSSTGSRNQLWTDANLEETGVFVPDEICFADFVSVDEPFICEGDSLVFTDLSYNGVTARQWTFEGGTPSVSTENYPVVTYDTPGNFNVTLTVSNASGSETVTKANLVHILPIGEYDVPFQEGFESFSSLENGNQNWFVTNSQDDDVQWELTTDAAYSGNKSVYLNGRVNTNGEVESLVSPTYDLSTINNTELGEEVYISFKYAHARRNSISNDVLKVMVSRNCGQSWATREIIDIDDLPTVSDNVTQVFVPDSQEEWREVIIDNVIPTYLSDEFRVKFEFTSFSGNNIYLDDINVYNSSSGPLSVSSVSFASEVKLYPNPSRDLSMLEYTLEKPANVQIDVLDLSGRIISQVYDGNQPSGAQRMNIQTSQLARGVYFIRVFSEGEQFITKLIRQ